MKRFLIPVVVSLIGAAWAFGCGGGKQVVKEGPEIFLPASFISSESADKVRLRCQGMGADLNLAVLNARKSCLDWFINDQLAQTAGEKQSYKAVQADVFNQLDKYVGIPPPGSRDGKGRGVKSRNRIGEDKIKVEIIEDVQKKALIADLEAMGVLKKADDTLDAVGLPTTAVLPSKANRGKKNRKVMEDLTRSYLTKAGWEVVDLGTVADINKKMEAYGEIAELEADENLQTALAAGADIFFEFEANKKTEDQYAKMVAFQVGINAKETSTGRSLASQASFSNPRVINDPADEDEALQEALNDAMGQVLPQVTNYWKKDVVKGRKFVVVFKNAPKRCDIEMSRVLKKNCTSAKLEQGTKTSVIFRTQCKLDNLELSDALDQAIQAKFSGAEVDMIKDRNSIVVTFQ